MNIYYSNKISWQSFRNEVCIINEETNKIYCLEGINRWFWLTLEYENNLDNILCELYSKVRNVSFETIKNDFTMMIDSLLNERLIDIKE